MTPERLLGGALGLIVGIVLGAYIANSGPACAQSAGEGYGPPSVETPAPTPGALGLPTVPLAQPAPSLEATGVEGVIVLVEPVEDLDGPSKYERPPTPSEQWDALPWVVQALLFLLLWSFLASLITVVGAGSEATEARLRRWGGKGTPKRRGW